MKSGKRQPVHEKKTGLVQKVPLKKKNAPVDRKKVKESEKTPDTDFHHEHSFTHQISK